MSIQRGRTDFRVEVAYPPFAYVMTIESGPDAIASTNITPFADVDFGYPPFPVDYHTTAMVVRDVERHNSVDDEA